MFELAYNLHSHFDQSSWTILFSVFQKVSLLVFKVDYKKSLKTPNVLNAKMIEKRIKVHKKYKEENSKHNCMSLLTVDKSSLRLNSLMIHNKEQSDVVAVTTENAELEKDIMLLKNLLKNLFTLTSDFSVD